MGRPRVIVLTAIRLETRAIAAAMGNPRLGADLSWRSSTPTCDVEGYTIGIRAPRLGDSPAAFAAEGATCIILAGLAGGLDPALQVGDLVADVPPSLADAFRRLGAIPGRIHASENLVATPAAKASLFQKTGAAAVEMESAAVQAVAQRFNVPFLHLRALSDSASVWVDPALLGLVDSLGCPRPARVARYLLGRPSRIIPLRRLGASSALAVQRLARLVSAFLQDRRPYP